MYPSARPTERILRAHAGILSRTPWRQKARARVRYPHWMHSTLPMDGWYCPGAQAPQASGHASDLLEYPEGHSLHLFVPAMAW